jgi:hypothetical protein
VKRQDIDFAPASPEEEVIQNVRTIIATLKYSVPLGRRFGVSAVMLDWPMPKAIVALQAEIMRVLTKIEESVI